MKMSQFLELLESSPNPILFDGAMGTQLHVRGASFQSCFDSLNLSNPALVAEIHHDFIMVGAQVIMTNTFGANRFKLADHGLAAVVTEINRAGVELARKAATASFKEVLVAGDVGPLGVRLAPFGRVQLEQAREAFAEQIQALADAGADLIIIETITDLYEAREAIFAAHDVCNLPVVASMTFTRDDRTLLGDAPAKVARELHRAGADVIGVNCSGGPAQILRIIKEMKEAVPEAHLSVMPNAGWPEQVAGRIMYPAGPDYFGDYALAFRHAGVSIIGGCCGTTPEHIRAMHTALESMPDSEYKNGLSIRMVEPAKAELSDDTPSQLAQKLAAGVFVAAVEMSPPRGLSTHKMQAGAGLLADAGADVINVADSPMARMRMSPWAVSQLIQHNIGIETTLHFPTRGRNLLRVQGDLLAAHAIGIRNVFVVMGDPTHIGDYPEAMDNYDLVPTGLLKLIKQGFNMGLDHSGTEIGQPTSFFAGAALNLTSREADREIKVLRRKLASGADFFLTQPVFDPAEAKAFLDQYAAEYGPLDKPVLAGILPLYNARHAAFLDNEVPGIDIPQEYLDRMEAAGEDAPKEGVRIALELIEAIRPFAQGVYLMPQFGRYEIAAEIVEAVKAKVAD
ncbi:MAG: bifunctional homocysteine S-methyltransferase/methylenetetrahydrofolate reductase [Anaerolineae bacterium]|nr:MAG: bifunctional homocysteine S-methyltransferase/methylenetetrahydrofolate reductase [Anaerolineae bacterium]